ncbi:peptide chain release factor N(5)-glutamine methyltransferase [Romeria aff. gracilis LEGE 07310]|uniref:Release factor glutamine methyltransferase n=1 Tax=Vasconcelosia minhoensis LEGE 07310 TaxID=915328 RepID=A0A8J7ABT6_9CYAN|nr:peptide chain release factor N(5)-glutamine methyltransferase [Romeria gracilis]MBE9077441.1 peptide chain release factor N(5)-glutamine methyltransferase [Romeria aff. gracilis LEGE 07310]
MGEGVARGVELVAWRRWAQQAAAAGGVPLAEVDWFLQAMTALDGLALRFETYAAEDSISLNVPLEILSQQWRRRVEERVPVQYLVGETRWRQFSLTVSPAVLIPRPETELMVEIVSQALERSPLREILRRGDWADLGTGSGAIALALANCFPQARVNAVDVSAAAIAIAQHNADRAGLSRQIQFHQGSWFEPLAGQQGLAGMVSNPPYIPHRTVLTLQPEVTQHEPHLALDGGDDGLDCIRHLVQTAPQYLQPGGLWLVETMAGQTEAVAALLRSQGQYEKISVHRDLAGHQRFVLAHRRKM